MEILVWPIILSLALFSGWFLTTGNETIILGFFGFVSILLLIFSSAEGFLPLFVLITLALGSAYRIDITQNSYYLRFVVLGLIALRSIKIIKVSKSVTPQFGRQTTLVHICSLAVCLFGLIMSVESVSPTMSLQKSISFLLLYVVIYFYFWKRAQTIENCEKFAQALWWSGLIILSIGFTFLILRVPGMFRAGRLRLVLGNPNQLGNYCAMISPIAFWFWHEKAKGKYLYFSRFLILALSTALVWSGSRGGLLAGGAALLILTSVCYRKQLIGLLLLVTFVAALQMLLGENTRIDRNDDNFFEQHVLRESQLTTGSGRTDVWKAAIRLIKQRPFLGYGFGVVDKMFEMGYFPELPAFQGGHIHNSYLEELINLGWVGAFPMFLSLLFLIGIGVKFLFQAKIHVDESIFRFGVALFGVIVAGMISGTFESWFTSVGSVFCFPFWFSAMLFLRVVQISKEKSA